MHVWTTNMKLFFSLYNRCFQFHDIDSITFSCDLFLTNFYLLKTHFRALRQERRQTPPPLPTQVFFNSFLPLLSPETFEKWTRIRFGNSAMRLFADRRFELISLSRSVSICFLWLAARETALRAQQTAPCLHPLVFFIFNLYLPLVLSSVFSTRACSRIRGAASGPSLYRSTDVRTYPKFYMSPAKHGFIRTTWLTGKLQNVLRWG